MSPLNRLVNISSTAVTNLDQGHGCVSGVKGFEPQTTRHGPNTDFLVEGPLLT